MPLKLHASLRYQSDLNVPIGSIKPFSHLAPQKAVSRGAPRGADAGDDAEGRRGPHPAAHRTHHTAHTRFGGRLRSALCPRARSLQLRVQRGALSEAPEKEETHTRGFFYGFNLKCSSTLLRKTISRLSEVQKKEHLKTKRSPLIVSVSRWRQHIALSSDISTWHAHAFLNSLPAPREK